MGNAFLNFIESALIALVVFTGLILSQLVDPLTAVALAIGAFFILPVFRMIRNLGRGLRTPRQHYSVRGAVILALIIFGLPFFIIANLPTWLPGLISAEQMFPLIMLAIAVGIIIWLLMMVLGRPHKSSGETHGHGH